VLKKALPDIGRASSKILGGPDYLGVQEVSRLDLVPHETSFTLRFSAECRQQDYLEVRRYLNRELLLLCEKEDLKLV